MRIVIIGGTGFIGGRVLAQVLLRKHEVLAVQRRISPVLPSSVKQLACEQQELMRVGPQLRAFRPDIVIDFVSSSAVQARSTVEVFTGYAGRLIAISSQDVYRAFAVFYGLEPGPLEPVPVTEDSPRRTRRESYPPELLARLKKLLGWVNDQYSNVEMEDVVMNVAALPATVLRLPMVYGPGDYLHRFYPILKRIRDGRQVIPIADTTAQWRSPRGYVEDVAAAIALAADMPEASGQVFNVAEEESFSELEWTEMVARAAGWSGAVVTIPIAKAPAHLHPPGNPAQHATCSSRRIREELGFRELTRREDALRETIAWERAHAPDPEPQFDYAAEDAALTDGQLA